MGRELISFAIPCYRSENTIKTVIEEIVSVMNDKKDIYDYEIIAAVDGSPDNAYSVLIEITKENKHIKVVNLSKNYGQASARMAALTYSKGDYVVCLDDDGQCPMDRFWDLLAPVINGYDVAISRYPKKKQSKFKNFGSWINCKMTHSLLDVPEGFKMTNFYILKKYIVDIIIKYTNPYPYMTGLLMQITRNICFVDMEERKRISGKTGYNFKKMISLWMNGFTNFSIKPLRISSFIGLVCALLGFIYGIYIVFSKIMFDNISAGWSSIISIILFIGGLIMLMLGMIGEYIGRIFICINNAPQYCIKNTINIERE